MSKYKKGIDFVVNTYEKREYLKLLVHSIHKYTKGIDYKNYRLYNNENTNVFIFRPYSHSNFTNI